MDISSWNWSAISIFCATFGGPIAAIQIQKYLERRQEQKRFKMNIFRTLMATRATRLSAEHVQALNGIELTFDVSHAKEKKVLEAWRAYHNHLNTRFGPEPGANVAWGERLIDLFYELLYQMSDCLGYKFDRTYIRNSAYAPEAHSTIEQELNAIRTGFVAILSGEKSLPVMNRYDLSDTDALAEFVEIRRLLLEWLRAVQPANVAASPHHDLERSDIRRLKIECIVALNGLRWIMSDEAGTPPDEYKAKFNNEINKIMPLWSDDPEVLKNMRDFLAERNNDRFILLLRNMGNTTKLSTKELSDADWRRVFHIPIGVKPGQIMPPPGTR